MLTLRSAIIHAFASYLAVAGAVSGAEQTATHRAQGLVIDFTAAPLAGERLERGGLATLRFRIADAADGEPVRGLYPAAWVDAGEAEPADRDRCGGLASRYLSGLVGIRPMVDLNSYFLMVMNRDASISVIDPIVGVTGITKLYAQVLLPRPAGDWALREDAAEMYVSMPRANAVGYVDAEAFRYDGATPVDPDALRVALQPDERYLWVGHGGERAGLTAIDVDAREVVGRLVLGEGHTELAITDDSRRVVATHRDSGTVSVIDVRSMSRVARIETGGAPLSVAFSPLSRLAYVADGELGAVIVIDPEDGAEIARVPLAPGLGPTKVSPDGRWVMIANPNENRVVVIDAADGSVAHRIRIGDRPYQIGFTRAFAYVRALDSMNVSMIALSALSRPEKPAVTRFAAGNRPPGQAAALSVADVATEAPGEAAVLVASPADKTVYYYMEGMNAPMGNFRNYGHEPVAVSVVDRSLREVEPGLYEANMKLPAAGPYEVIFLLDTPRVLNCFRMRVEENPALAPDVGPFRLLLNASKAVAGEPVDLRFELIDPVTVEPIAGASDVEVVAFRAPGLDRVTLRALPLDDGGYRVRFVPKSPGAHYFYAGAQSLGARVGESVYATLLVRGAPAKPTDMED
jgi:YVTN family beta-propeller protein